ncbi:MAG: acyl-CoA dehydrogenase C-terminal domain-containing protein [Hydrogenophaga sp.]|nr:acyl-CoA dehydrogenase C-terminal domain-containing protein [Hydrogenophaga sp.]
MPIYTAPVDDWQFLLHDVLHVDQHAELPGFTDLDPDFTGAVLNAAARFHEEVLHPINLQADAEGAHIQNGQVQTPQGYIEAWAAYRAAGWHRISLPAALGGGGLPPIMSVPISELRASTGHSFSMYSSFCAPTASMLSRLGQPWMQTHVVPRLSDGDWTATMCMTEPQAGTDLRQLGTRAVAQADGTWRITGRKIFISGGEHDLTDNIVHVVLAKVPDASGQLPRGLSAVNVFLVSKRLIDPATGALGALNGVHARSIEHKMGIEGSATCALDFEDAVAWRIADDRRTGTSANMAPMFLLMNYARVGTAMSGIAYAEIARQNAAAYARERLSGQASTPSRYPQQVADPLIAHADVRRLLLESRAFAEGARAGALRAALWQSVAEHATDPAAKAEASDLLEILTPVMKAYFTDKGFEAAVACQQVLGGHGYVKDYGLEQYVRNARIGQLYEGANGIQAMDLLHRKLNLHHGRAQRSFLSALAGCVERHAHNPQLHAFTAPLAAGLERLRTTLDWLAEHTAAAPDRANAGAYDVLTVFGILYIGWNWVDMAAVAANPEACRFASAQTRQTKLQLGRIWMDRQMPLIHTLCVRIESGNDALMQIADELI